MTGYGTGVVLSPSWPIAPFRALANFGRYRVWRTSIKPRRPPSAPSSALEVAAKPAILARQFIGDDAWQAAGRGLPSFTASKWRRAAALSTSALAATARRSSFWAALAIRETR